MDEQMEMEPSIELGEKLVHLDLKGAPPKICYYEKIFPLLHQWGATGLLLEYEDMFPYHGDLSVLQARNVYSIEEVNRIQSLAEQNNLTITPLVQTFGHLEFALKHKKFQHLQEIPTIPMSLCPLHKESLPLVQNMLDQVIEAHPNIQSIHIGADEVFFIASCPQCVSHMDEEGISSTQLFVSFVVKVIRQLKHKYPKLRVVMWDDMLRKASTDEIKDSGIGELAEPMVWAYEKALRLPDDLWPKYTNIFESMWVASAFKGATGPCMTVTDIDYHVGNHLAWLRVIKDQLLHQKGLQGFCITGWQRYDHYAVLCELLPVALPSLAVCLSTLVNGSFTMQVHHQASEDLDFSGLIPLSPSKCIGVQHECKFAGSAVYCCIEQHLLMMERYHFFIYNDSYRGWMSEHQLKRNYTNPAHLRNLLPEAHQLLQGFQCIQSDLYKVMPEIFYMDTVEEWIAVNITPIIQKLQTVVEDIEKQLNVALHRAGSSTKTLSNSYINVDKAT